MSQPDLSSASPSRGVIVQKPKTSIYTVMLIIALIGLLMGCLFLWLEIAEYGAFGTA